MKNTKKELERGFREQSCDGIPVEKLDTIHIPYTHTLLSSPSLSPSFRTTEEMLTNPRPTRALFEVEKSSGLVCIDNGENEQGTLGSAQWQSG